MRDPQATLLNNHCTRQAMARAVRLLLVCVFALLGTYAASAKNSDEETCRAVQRKIPTPEELKKGVKVNPKAFATVQKTRAAIKEILDTRSDSRLLVIVGPCSIHDVEETMEYAHRLVKLARTLESELVIVMRTYFEKPRTRIGWKGFINDPDADQRYDMIRGLQEARQLLADINELGLPCATEFLDPLIEPYISDLISWGSTGARTVDSQVHREMVSGLEMPVGVKHDVYGHVDYGMDALMSVSNPHNHLALMQDGSLAQVRTSGNNYAHMVLRGGGEVAHKGLGTNFDPIAIYETSARLSVFDLCRKVVVDLGHGNSNKKVEGTMFAVKELLKLVGEHKIDSGSKVFPVAGVMFESNLETGSQKIPVYDNTGVDALRKGLSLTDPCIGWKETEEVLKAFSRAIKMHRTREEQIQRQQHSEAKQMEGVHQTGQDQNSKLFQAFKKHKIDAKA